MLEMAAVELRNAFKSYGKGNVILRGLNMTIPEGVIYGLLGPSGCGKTTIVNCLVGLTILDHGVIWMKYGNHNIGYMPQSIALHEQFSIKETLHYYGNIYGMTTKCINNRSKDLISYLELPSQEDVLSSLSGGEQRRVSLCVALLHNPQMLILDEPTVGIDPILCHSIWQKLKLISSEENRTILITTHYIEEAKQADFVGFMREGVLLTEAVPADLMREQNCDTLEQAFLNLCQKQPINAINQSNSVTRRKSRDKPKSKSLDCIGNWKHISRNRIWALILKNFYWMKRNICMMLFVMMLPMIQCFLMNITIGQSPKGLSLAIVNHEFLEPNTGCADILNRNFTDYNKLSCFFISRLQKQSHKTVFFNDIELAKEAVRTNKVWGLVYFNRNYSMSLLKRMIKMGTASDETIDQSEVKIWLDMSDYIIGNTLRSDIAVAFAQSMGQVFRGSNFAATITHLPIKYNNPIYGSWNPSFVHFSTPGVIVLSEFYQPMMFTVGAVIMDKAAGILQRSLVSGVTFNELFLTQVVIQYIVLTVQTMLMMFVLFYVFDNPLEGSISLCLVLLFFIGTTGMFYGFFVAALCNSFTSATFFGLGSYFPLFVLSGMIWPLQGMHYTLRILGFLLPLTLSIESFRGISSRAWTLTHPKVYPGFLSSFVWTFLLLILTFLVIKHKGMVEK